MGQQEVFAEECTACSRARIPTTLSTYVWQIRAYDYFFVKQMLDQEGFPPASFRYDEAQFIPTGDFVAKRWKRLRYCWLQPMAP